MLTEDGKYILINYGSVSSQPADKIRADILSCFVEKCSKLIDMVVNVMPQWKQEFILEYIKGNKSIEDFKKIHLFPMSASWSGSEVPLILDKIEFLQDLKEKMKGVSYIEHREYIDEYRRDLEEYKRKVELREYLEEADYA